MHHSRKGVDEYLPTVVLILGLLLVRFKEACVAVDGLGWGRWMRMRLSSCSCSCARRIRKTTGFLLHRAGDNRPADQGDVDVMSLLILCLLILVCQRGEGEWVWFDHEKFRCGTKSTMHDFSLPKFGVSVGVVIIYRCHYHSLSAPPLKLDVIAISLSGAK